MTAQAIDCSNDASVNDFIDFNRVIAEVNNLWHVSNASNLNNGYQQLHPSAGFSSVNPINTGVFAQKNTVNEPSSTNSPEYDENFAVKQSNQSSNLFDDEIISLLLEMTPNGRMPITMDAQHSVQAIERQLRNEVENLSNQNAEAVKTAIKRTQQSVMRMRVQPVSRQRFRYQTENRRFLKNSRSRPMSIQLPRLVGYLTDVNQSFWIKGTLVTTRRNPHRKRFYHQHQIFYDGEDAQLINSQSFRVKLTNEDLRRRIKQLKRVSIVKTRLDDYNFHLVPFDPLLLDDYVIHYMADDDENLTKIQKSKIFDAEYHTEKLRIIWELMLEQRNQWYSMDISCKTCIITDS